MKQLIIICAGVVSLIMPVFGASGPFVGHMESDSGMIWYRADSAGTYRVKLVDTDALGVVVAQSDQVASADADYTLHFTVTNLTAETAYQYEVFRVDGGETPVAGGTGDYVLTTWPEEQDGSVVVLGMGSGVNSTANNLWPRIAQEGCEAFILLGDSPYINNTDLIVQRDAYRSFADVANMADLYRSCVLWGTWDDHDFGLNNSNGGNTPGKAERRQAFMEYRVNPSYGEGDLGVYTRFQAGGAEVFLLDPRWFSQTEPSPVDASRTSCFGAAQWQWLLEGLTNSTAKFKLLTFGQIWEDKKNSETDDMGTYWYERNALFDFVREHQIPGVVLIGGDIHVSRHLVRRNRVGYDLQEFVTSPMHTSTIASLDVYNPHLEWSAVEPNTFLKLTVDCQSSPASLMAEYILQDGSRIHTVTLTEDDLEPQEALTGLANGLRGYWRFEATAANQSVLGDYLDATAVNGAQAGVAGGILGNGALLDRSGSQYFYVPHTVLEEDADAYTFSVWMKATGTPDGINRWFLGETTLEGEVSSDSGYALSVGLREGSATEDTKLQLYTYTLDGGSEGPYDHDVADTVIDGVWRHVAVTYDGDCICLYLDGSLMTNVDVVNDGALIETGGFVLGGHRDGTGRNFNGMLDEVAIWERALDNTEIAALYNDGDGVVIYTPPPPVVPAVSAARVQITGTDNASTTYNVLNQTSGFSLSFPVLNEGDHQIFSSNSRLLQTDGIIIGSANDGGDSIVQVGGDLTYGSTAGAPWNEGMAFSTADQSGGGEKNFDTSFAYFPFSTDWIAAHVSSDGTILAGPHLPDGTTVTKLSTTPEWRGSGNFTVHIPGVDSRTDGMLFVVGGENDNNVTVAGVFEDADDVNITAGDAVLGDWHVHIRDAAQNDTSDVGEDSTFSFIYLPYKTVNLIGGRIKDDGVVPVLKSTGTFTVSDGDSTGQVDISIPDGQGGFLSDQDGILILTCSAVIDNINSGTNQDPVDGNVLSWTYDAADEEFVVHAFDAPGGGAQDVRDFVFAFVPYEDSLQPPYSTRTLIVIK